jgi:peptide/nickel transport system permease protein
MATYMLRRFLQCIGFIAVAWLVVYTVVVLLTPNGPKQRYDREIATFREMSGLSDVSSPETDLLEQRYKVDKPWPINFFYWLFDPDIRQIEDAVEGPFAQRAEHKPNIVDIQIGGISIHGAGILTGDLGQSVRVYRGRVVSELVGEAWMHTAILVSISLVLAVVFAVPLGVVGAVRQRSKLDHALTFFSFAGFSMPLFQIGLILMIWLAVFPYFWHTRDGWTWMPYLPAIGVSDPDQHENWINRVYHLVLPTLTLALPQAVLLSRYIRSSLVEVLKQDYIRTARAKGLSTRRVVWKHGLRNALIPLITIVGVMLPGLISGAIIVETLFGYPGVGQMYYKSLGGCLPSLLSLDTCPEGGYPIDYPPALALTLIFIVIVAFSNLITDYLYTLADPRVSLTARQQS